MPQSDLPAWADIVLVPLTALFFAALLSGFAIWALGYDPLSAWSTMVSGALGSSYAWGYTLYYTTNFIFTGLAFAVAFHARLFNIGAEGQAELGALGVALACLFLPLPHWLIALPIALLCGALLGALWALLPAVLQAWRGSHIVITTIMFNFLAFSLMNGLLSHVLIVPGSGDPATARFPEATNLPTFYDIFSLFGLELFRSTPLNISLIVALIASVGVWVLLWRMRLGYELRAFGHSETAARYGGLSGRQLIVIAMLISGALAGMMSINTVQGEAERLVLNSVEEAGFIGIAVALMGRSHPVGVILAALLFGFVYQGVSELSLWESIPGELKRVILGFVILFTGALDYMVRWILRLALAPILQRSNKTATT